MMMRNPKKDELDVMRAPVSLPQLVDVPAPHSLITDVNGLSADVPAPPPLADMPAPSSAQPVDAAFQ